MTTYEQIVSIALTCSDSELALLISKCQNELKLRQDAAREALRIKLMENLQKAISDVLHNGFNLTIENIDYPEWVVEFAPDDIYSVKMSSE